LGKQDETSPKKDVKLANMSRKHLFALWGTLITVLGTSVVPKIIDMLSDRPSVTDVQDMIAEQTKVLTQTVNKNIDALKELDDGLHELDKGLAHLQGLDESLREVVRDCCTRRIRNMEARLKPTPGPEPKPKPEPLSSAIVTLGPDGIDVSEAAKKLMEKLKADEAKGPAMQQQQKLPEFNPKWIQQKAE
jgi:hypothetical protein